MPFNDSPRCRSCGTPFVKTRCEQRLCDPCWHKTPAGQRALAAQEKRERRKKRKADRLWRQREKVNRALAKVEEARQALAELEAAGEAGPDRRTRGEAGPAKNVRDPSTGQFLRTTPPVEPKPEKQREKRKAWFQCGNRPCIGRMSHPCDGCGVAESPQEAQNDVLSDSADRTTRTSTEPENAQERGSQPPGGDRDRDQVVLRLVAEAKADREDAAQGGGEDEEETEEPHVTACPRDPAEAQSVLDRLGRESRTGAPPPGGDRDQAVLRFVAEAKEAREKQDDEESLIETTSNPLLED